MNRQIILGMGAGQCGTGLLTEILNQQPGAHVTHQRPPLLPWISDESTGGIQERLQRLLETHEARLVGDVAAFYLPYVEEAIRVEPRIRILCLKRPREEVVEGFCQYLDGAFPFPVNHWARELAPGWCHDPVWTRTFPQYDTQDRAEGIGRYWDEYYQRVDELLVQHPENVRLWDTEILTTEAGVREVLTFAGIPESEQTIVTGQRTPPSESSPQPTAPRQALAPMDPRKCVILVPFSGFIHQECEDALEELERRGYRVRRVGGYAAIDQGRNQMATDALVDGFEETLWIDSDVAFHPDSVDQLRAHPHPIVAGIYPQKGKQALACHVAPGARSMVFGKRGGLVEVLYTGTGFMLVRREAYMTIQRKLKLPVCNERFGRPMIPFFQPMVRPIEEGHWYLAEDYAFCERAQQCGYRIYADTSIRLWHIGSYQYGWEDAGLKRQRFDTFTLNFSKAPRTARATETERSPKLANFASQYAWPPQRPEVPPFPQRDGHGPGKLLTDCVSQSTKLVVEVGAWTGNATRFLARLAPEATIIAIDSWDGLRQQQEDPELAPFVSRLHETFLSECWNYRGQIVPVKSSTDEGLQRVAEDGLEADLVYFGAYENAEGLHRDLSAALELFPTAIIAGDGLDKDRVRETLETVTRERNIEYETVASGWRILRSERPAEEQPPAVSIDMRPPDSPDPR